MILKGIPIIFRIFSCPGVGVTPGPKTINMKRIRPLRAPK
jgi:hypothetical protein